MQKYGIIPYIYISPFLEPMLSPFYQLLLIVRVQCQITEAYLSHLISCVNNFRWLFSAEYWFRCMDLDGDGYISMYEMEYFYEEQSQKLEQLDIEPLPFEDCVCQVQQVRDFYLPHQKRRLINNQLHNFFSIKAHVFINLVFILAPLSKRRPNCLEIICFDLNLLRPLSTPAPIVLSVRWCNTYQHP